MISSRNDGIVCVFDVRFLFFPSVSFNQPNSSFFATVDIIIQLLGIPSEASEGVEVPILVLERSCFVVSVTSFCRISDSTVENFYTIFVKYCDIIG